MLASLIAGLVAGTLHALSGPDHLAAITPLSISHNERTGSSTGAWRIGLRWGLGHALGVALMGGLLFLFRQAFDLERFAWWSERMVGVVLIGLGVWGLRRATSRWMHSHHHEHDGAEHAHIHFHRLGDEAESAAHRHSHTAMAVGLLHGFAGTTHVFGLIPALALPAAFAAVYLGGYGAGNLLAMGGFAWLVGWAGARLSEWGVSAYRILLGAASAGAIALGAVWLFAA